VDAIIDAANCIRAFLFLKTALSRGLAVLVAAAYPLCSSK
jgi:hypothetical protein